MTIYVALCAALFALAAIRIVPSDRIRVVDGDSIVLKKRSIFGTRYELKCRLLGLDAPEWNQPHGREAARALRLMIRKRRVLILSLGQDRYGRRLVRLYTMAGPVTARMLARGHAHPAGLPGDIISLPARLRRTGLWKGPVIHPATWRSKT